MLNKNIFSFFVLLFISAFIFTGCSQKVTVKSLKPALVDNQAMKKTAILAFESDNYGLREAVIANMNKVKFDGKNYFSIVNRKDTQKILQEQKLQDSGLVNLENFKQFGLSDVDSIITGKILLKDYSTDYYQKERYNYKRCLRYSDDGKTCLRYQIYRINCKQEFYNLSANITITDIKNGDIIYTNKYDKEYSQEKCTNEYTRMLTSHQVYSNLAKDIAHNFVSTISPTTEYHQIVVLEDEDIDYTDEQETYLENGLKLLELGDYRNANRVFSQLVASTNYKSATALYNLALCFELEGDLQKANDFYQKAKNITILEEMNETIIQNARRIQLKIEENTKALTQINK